jgi:hypothetical protein
MANYTLKVELTPEDEQRLADLGTLVDRQKAKENKARILAERGRTIDQIKRLYAVVMGYALITCFTNAYLCYRALDKYSWDANSILIAPVISFTSLIALFFLGAERMLDRKYLQESKPKPPTRAGLLIDLATLGISAAWFVILANIFQPPTGTAKLTIGNLHEFQTRFINAVLVLYVLDLVLLAVQAIVILVQTGWGGRADDIFKAHLKWLGINVVSATFLCGTLYLSDGTFSKYEIGIVASCLVLIHLVRFFWDFLWTFEFYYPKESW